MTKVKCKQCKTKLGLMIFTCKCQNVFCLNCLLPEKHNCTFDYKAEGKKNIEKRNPVVVNHKVPSI